MESRSSIRNVAFGLVAVSIGLTVAACDEKLIAPSVSPIDLVTTSPWKLQSMERPGAGLARAPDPERFTLQFDEQGRVFVLTDCNRCSGSYSIGAGTVTVGAMACTRAFCATAPFDTDYVGVLGGVSAVGVTAATLDLSSSRGTLRFAR